MDKPDLSHFPLTPGVYLYKDDQGRIIYVGKARKLRQRIASYFRDEAALPIKTRNMLRNARSIDILNTATEKEALLLESSLIKKHRPRYNIILRDDKEYLLFYIGTAHPYPRVEIVRHNAKKRHIAKGRFFGPFSSGTAAKETWKLIHKYFPLRRCRDTAFKNRTRPCLYHHIGQCLAPCVLPVSQQEYQKLLQEVSLILSGRSRELIETLEKEMHQAAENLLFELAVQRRDQITALRHTVEQQSVVLEAGVDLDLIGVTELPEGLALGIVFVRDGLLLDGRNFFWPALTVEDTPELLYSFLSQFYLQSKAPIPGRIIVPWLPDTTGSSPLAQQSTQPPSSWAEALQDLTAALTEQRGSLLYINRPRNQDEDRLLLLAASNAKEAAKSKKAPPISELLANILHAQHPIERIECVDISHTGGQQTRAGMVVFHKQEPVPSDYRAYALDKNLEQMQAEAGDDYAALAAWATRRVRAGAPWPDLLLIDGGKGQLQAVANIFSQEGLLHNFVLASIAKARTENGKADRRAGNTADRIFLPGRVNPVNIHAGSPELLFLQRVRDAAHDFVLGRHRQARAAATMSGELARLPGIGPHLTKALFDTFGSLNAMAAASADELRKVPGVGKARAAMLSERLAQLVATK